MSGALRLPPALLDLTLLRATTHTSSPAYRQLCRCPRNAWKRWAHGAAVLAEQPPQDLSDHLMTSDGRSIYAKASIRHEQQASGQFFMTSFERDTGHSSMELSELEKRVLALKETVRSELYLDPTTYSEDELLQFYEDILSPTPTGSSDVSSHQENITLRMQQEGDRRTVERVAHRLSSTSDTGSPSTRIPQSSHLEVISRLQDVISAVERFRSTPSTSENQDDRDALLVPHIATGLLIDQEWIALTRTCLIAQGGAAAEIVLDIMQRSGALSLEGCTNEVISFYASAGDITNTERVLHTFVGPSLSEHQLDLHVKAHIKATPSTVFPTKALTLLHEYEQAGTPAPQKSYTRAITALLSMQNTQAEAHAQAWDLFAHMRYAAHPEPDVALYTLMLRACGHPAAPAEPERALDLFTEMTADRGLTPTAGAYAAAAYAYARSGEARYVHEAFRLAKEMLDSHRDAHGVSAFKPDRRLFGALVEGAKRIGDLTRVRWILAEMVREMAAADGATGSHEVLINESIVRHVFHAYASYKPPFHRADTVFVDQQSSTKQTSPTMETNSLPELTSTGGGEIAQSNSQSVNPEGEDRSISDPSTYGHFSQLPPQTHTGVVREAKALLGRIVEDRHFNPSLTGHMHESTHLHPFRHVQLTAQLLNSYLTVHYAHSPIETWSHLYRTLFDKLNVSRNSKSYVEALERCATSRRIDRPTALKLAEEIWDTWHQLEERWRSLRGCHVEDDDVRNVNARLVERANAAMIRLLTLTDNTGRALAHIKDFATRYPPAALVQVSPKHPLRSTRTVLFAAKPLVRLTSVVDIPDDSVPPFLTFTDLEILHHRLVAMGDTAGIKYLRWLCKSYEGLLRRRRDATIHSRPGGPPPAT